MSRFRNSQASGFFAGSKPDTEKVIAMDGFRSRASLSPLRQAEAYWNALRQGADVPSRARIDPRGLESVLEYAFILERIAPGIARFRLAGQHLTALAGMEVRGMPLTALFTAAARGHVSAVLEHVFDTPAVAELGLRGGARIGHAPVAARMILLPLKNDAGDISRALGVLVADSTTAIRTPCRFDIGNTGLRPVSGLQVARLDLPPDTGFAGAGFAQDQRPLAIPAAATRPHLRLVQSDGT
jgi:hypothetical protein